MPASSLSLNLEADQICGIQRTLSDFPLSLSDSPQIFKLFEVERYSTGNSDSFIRLLLSQFSTRALYSDIIYTPGILVPLPHSIET